MPAFPDVLPQPSPLTEGVSVTTSAAPMSGRAGHHTPDDASPRPSEMSQPGTIGGDTQAFLIAASFADSARPPLGAPPTTEPGQGLFAPVLGAHLVATYEGSLALLLARIFGKPVRVEPRQQREQVASDLGMETRERLHLNDVDRVIRRESILTWSGPPSLSSTTAIFPMGRHPFIDGLLTEPQRRPLGMVLAESLPACRWQLYWHSTRSWSRAWLPQGRYCIKRRLVVGIPGQPPLLHLETAISPHLVAPTAVDLASARRQAS